MSGNASHPTDALISAALLGAARMTSLPPAPDAALAETWAAIPMENPAEGMLQALALTRALRRSGVATVEAPGAGEAANEETRPALAPAATALLMRTLKGDSPETLAECMRLAQDTRRILPGRALPEMLQAATKHAALRPACRVLAGERGVWIARRRKEFSWLLEEAAVPESAWDDGEPAERLAWLRQTRLAEAERAAAAIVAQWGGEDVPMREAIVKLVAESPQACDEEWLENLALKDRRAEVREQAIAALTALPGSGFRQRAATRLKACVEVKRKLLKRALEIKPPDAFSPEWAKDGLKEKPPQGTGEKAFWLRQIVAAVPLCDWPPILETGEDELFSLKLDSDWKDTLLAGWIEGARRRPGLSLPQKLLPYLARMDAWPATAMLPKSVLLAAMLRELPLAGRYRILDELVAGLDDTAALDLLYAAGEPPPPGAGKKILAVLNHALAQSPPVIARHLAKALAVCVPQEGIQPALEIISRLPQIDSAIEDFATTLEFRRSLYLHFSDSTSPSPS